MQEYILCNSDFCFLFSTFHFMISVLCLLLFINPLYNCAQYKLHVSNLAMLRSMLFFRKKPSGNRTGIFQCFELLILKHRIDILTAGQNKSVLCYPGGVFSRVVVSDACKILAGRMYIRKNGVSLVQKPFGKVHLLQLFADSFPENTLRMLHQGIKEQDPGFSHICKECSAEVINQVILDTWQALQCVYHMPLPVLPGIRQGICLWALHCHCHC